MDGIHDMGGMQGFGPVPYERNEAPFHESWERRMWGLMFATTPPQDATLDGARANLERIPPHLYLSFSYYERWMYHLVSAQLASGAITLDEIKSGKPGEHALVRDDAAGADTVDPYAVTEYRRDVSAQPKFKVGDKVRTLNSQTPGHTRLPRYAREKYGKISLHHGAHVLPDTNAHGQGENPTHLYTVTFSATTLWGAEANAKDVVSLDVWECHLERA